MTKEEILKGNYEKVFYPQKYESKVNRKLTESFALPAMDDYAKQEAIAFAEYCSNSGRELYPYGKWSGNIMGGEPDLTTEQLYSLFLEQK